MGGGAAISNPLSRFNWFVFRMLLYFAYRVKHETKIFTSICATGGIPSILHTSFSMFLNKKLTKPGQTKLWEYLVLLLMSCKVYGLRRVNCADFWCFLRNRS